jgi:hypothetical protein
MERQVLNAKVIRIHEHKHRYKEVKKEVLVELQKVQAKLFTSAIELLTSYKWKEWSDKLPYGSEFKFEELAMRDAGDEFVNEVLVLKERIEEIIERNRI